MQPEYIISILIVVFTGLGFVMGVAHEQKRQRMARYKELGRKMKEERPHD